MTIKINRIKTTFGQSGSSALLKTLELENFETQKCDQASQTEDELTIQKINDERIANAETFLVPSVADNLLDLEEDLKPVEIYFDENFEIDGCNSEGALEPRDLIEIDAFGMEDRGRSSETAPNRKFAKSPQPKCF